MAHTKQKPISVMSRARHLAATNVLLWRKTFWETWEPLPWHVKLSWVAFATQTMAVITLLELCAFKQ